MKPAGQPSVELSELLQQLRAANSIQEKDAVLRFHEGRKIFIPPVRKDILQNSAPSLLLSSGELTSSKSSHAISPRQRRDSQSSASSNSGSVSSLTHSLESVDTDESDDEESPSVAHRRRRELRKAEKSFKAQLQQLQSTAATTAHGMMPRSQLSIDLEKLLTCEKLYDFTIRLSCGSTFRCNKLIAIQRSAFLRELIASTESNTVVVVGARSLLLSPPSSSYSPLTSSPHQNKKSKKSDKKSKSEKASTSSSPSSTDRVQITLRSVQAADFPHFLRFLYTADCRSILTSSVEQLVGLCGSLIALRCQEFLAYVMRELQLRGASLAVACDMLRLLEELETRLKADSIKCDDLQPLTKFMLRLIACSQAESLEELGMSSLSVDTTEMLVKELYAIRDKNSIQPAPIPVSDTHSTLYADIAGAFTNGTPTQAGLDCDCVLVAEDPVTVVRAHRCILVARSAFFEGAFTSSFAESRQARVEVALSANAFEHLLSYMYTNRVVPQNAQPPSREILYELAETSDFFAFGDARLVRQCLWALNPQLLFDDPVAEAFAAAKAVPPKALLCPLPGKLRTMMRCKSCGRKWICASCAACHPLCTFGPRLQLKEQACECSTSGRCKNFAK